jgi:hypothetical protein
MPALTFRPRRRALLAVGALALSAAASTLAIPATAASASQAHTSKAASETGNGLAPGAIKHVWLIILENKSYDATFTGLNKNSYLWQTLPSQGVLLKDYYGTGHFSLDNYTSLVSGQGPAPADQNDCPVYADMQGAVEGASAGVNNGQFAETGAPYANSLAGGANEGGTNDGTGCVYPKSVPTLFNQFDSAGVSWKGYAQDLGNTDSTGPAHDVNSCGGPGNPAGVGVTNPGSANATDQYVPKHFPFPWFESLLSNPNDCNPAHIANLFSPTSGLYSDLQSEATTPAFSWITPNNCSDAHDAVCAGNNLSGGFSDPNTPKAPTNYTGGLYASDLFLQHVVPEIEQSAAFKDGGLIDITFDEANPPFANSSFNNSSKPATASTYIQSDLAGENINGTNVPKEPAGPNTPLLADSQGQQVYPGPGDAGFIDKPNSLTGDATNDPKYVKGGAGSVPGTRTDTTGINGGTGGSTIVDPAILATDAGRPVSGTNIPAGSLVGPVSDTGPVFNTVANGTTNTNPSNPLNKAYQGSFQLVDASGNPVTPTGLVNSITFPAETAANDPLYDTTDPTPGGGDTGSVLISPYITPGTSTTVDYDHYSWLRSMEDIFQVDKNGASPGLDGLGHIGFAAESGLTPFGPDVFNNPNGDTPSPALPEAPFAIGLPLIAVAALGGATVYRRRRKQKAAAV